MSIDSKFLNLFIKATEKAAIGASKFVGKNDKIQSKAGIQFIEISLGKYPFGSLKLTESLPKDFAHVPSVLITPI